MLDKTQIGAALRKAMKSAGYSQDSLSKAIHGDGVSVTGDTIGRWTRGQHLPTLEAFAWFCARFKLDPVDLLDLPMPCPRGACGHALADHDTLKPYCVEGCPCGKDAAHDHRAREAIDARGWELTDAEWKRRGLPSVPDLVTAS